MGHTGRVRYYLHKNNSATDHVQVNLTFTNFQNFMLLESSVIVVYLSVGYSYFLIAMVGGCTIEKISLISISIL